MPTAKRLPSGSWRCLVYSHNEIKRDKKGNILYDKNGKPKEKRIYQSFTSDNKTKRGKAEAQRMANDFILERKTKIEKLKRVENMTLLEAVDIYIDQRRNLLSPTTIRDYEITKKNAFQDIMNIKLSEFDVDMLQNAINRESVRSSNVCRENPKAISKKRLLNEYGLIRPVLRKYRKDIDYSSIVLPKKEKIFKDLISPDVILKVVKGTEIELPVLLAMWLSFTASEIRGLTKSKSISGNYVTIVEVLVDGANGPVRKSLAKNKTRNRRHRIPPYIKTLINRIDGDVLVPLSGNQIYSKWVRLLEKNHLPHMTFHDLRHVNASVMALLRIPDKYAQERGGWETDQIMKRVYQETFPEERKNVDDVIDNYFISKMQHDIQHENNNSTE